MNLLNRPDYVCFNGCGYVAIEDMVYDEEHDSLACPNCKGITWYIELKGDFK